MRRRQSNNKGGNINNKAHTVRLASPRRASTCSLAGWLGWLRWLGQSTLRVSRDGKRPMASCSTAADAGFPPARRDATAAAGVLDARAGHCRPHRRLAGLAGLALTLALVLELLSASPVLAKNHVLEKPAKVLGE